MQLRELGKIIKSKRSEMGFTQLQLAKLAGLSRTTINQIESGTINDVGFNKLADLLSVLGLSFDACPTGAIKHPLQVAARTASTSYKNILSPAVLKKMLSTGVAVKEYESHMATLLEEAPVPVVVMAIQAAAEATGTPMKTMMQNVSTFAHNLGVYRKVW